MAGLGGSVTSVPPEAKWKFFKVEIHLDLGEMDIFELSLWLENRAI